jgi:CubicO group peptidase (beta-lactamase class C family)
VTIDELLRREIDLGSFPGASYAVGSFERLEQTGAAGNAITVPMRIPATAETIYDCASITKALITPTLVLHLGLLDESIHGFPARRLLTHTSGLRAWMPLYAYDDPLRAILEQGPEYEPGTRVVYSDLNFVLLWMLIGPERYVQLVQSVISPDCLFAPGPSPRVAATEWGQRFEAKLASRYDIPGVRQALMWGDTNDGNSFHIGIEQSAGNAGLFATAATVFAIAQRIARGELYDIDFATRDFTSQVGEPRGLGWQLASPDSPATAMLSPGSYGHMGFTGTSVWIDRERERIMVLLTNRVHPCAGPIAMQRIRGDFHRLALA